MSGKYFVSIIFLIGMLFTSTAVQPVSGAEWETYSDAGGIFSSGPIPSDIVQALWTDGTDLWVGSYKGIVKYNGTKWSTVYYGSYWKIKHGQAQGFPGNVDVMPDNRINCILEVKEEIWFGTDKGIVAYHPRMGQWRQVLFGHPVLDSAYIQLLRKERDRVWIGSWGDGLACYDTKRNSLRTFKDTNGFIGSHVSGLAITGTTLWVGTLYNGLNKFNLKTGRWMHLHEKNSILPSNTIRTMAVSEEGKPHVWIATGGGVLQIFPDEDSIPLYTMENSKLPTDEVDTILLNGDTVWFATRMGVCTLRNNVWKQVRLPSSLKGKRINQMLPYQGAIWFATQHAGLVKYTP